MAKLSEKIESSKLVFTSEHPITLDYIHIRDFDGHNFWISNDHGEAMAIPKIQMIRFFTKVHDEFNKIFKRNF